MNLKALLTYLLKEDTTDEEERTGTGSGNTKDAEKVASGANVIANSGGTTDENDEDFEHDDQEYDDTLPNANLDNPDASPRGLRRIFSRVLSSVLPHPSDEEEIQAYIPHYRILPIASGIIIPFCILLEIPGLTEHWYILTDGSTIIASKPNPPLIDVGMALSLLCAVLANACLIFRFLEMRIKTMTILCTLFLSIHGKLTITYLARRDTHIVFRYYQRRCSRCIRSDKGWVRVRAAILDDFMFYNRVHVHERDPHYRSHSNF